MASLFQKDQEEYKRKSEIKTCVCGRLYIKTRIGQETCFFCIDKKDIPNFPLLISNKGAKLKLAH